MSDQTPLSFDHSGILTRLAVLDDTEIDRLEFGVIGFDADTVVRRYNAFESKCAGLTPGRVVGQPLFTIVAPCMNNYLVAQRFEDAATNRTSLDVTVDYVLTLRMRPQKVHLRLLASPDQTLRYLLVSSRQ